MYSNKKYTAITEYIAVTENAVQGYSFQRSKKEQPTKKWRFEFSFLAGKATCGIKHIVRI